MKILNSYLAFAVFIFASCATHQANLTEQPLSQKRTQAQSSPQAQFSSEVLTPVKMLTASITLKNEFYTVNYNPEKNIANYTDYVLTGEMLSTHVQTKRNFKPDVRLKEYGLPVPTTKWYTGSGYDRGHLTPLEDMGFGIASYTSTNLMSNISPQEKQLNSPAWATLERVIRNWGCKEGAIRVITGTIFQDDYGQLNDKPVVIPSHFYKAILDLTPPRKAIAFVMSQKDRGSNTYIDRVTTVAEVEKMVGYNIFADINTDEQQQIEQKSDLSDWRERTKICFKAGYKRKN